MKVFLGLLVALATLAAVEGASAAEPIGTVVRTAQTVKASGAQGTRVLARSDDVFFMDRISSNGTGSGEFQFSDGTKLAVGPGASLSVDEFVFQSKSRFQKLGLAATRGTFRWISGGSASSAYRIKTPNGTLGIRGTALDVTIRNGRVYVALINGSAKFCSGSTCRTLKKSCDFIVADGRKISEPAHASTATTKQETAAQLFPYLANPSRLSSRFRVGGGNCLGRLASVGKNKVTTAVENVPAAEPEPEPETEAPTGKCGGNCGKGKGRGGGNGTPNEGKGNN
ncbi:MAG: FecR domain-containing protein [Hyphomicrobiales bacterium]|nr:FecR domain-containing protein [Hyphomicrobiales bacterium]